MNNVTCTGGARIGWVNATWPFAKLIATSEKLKLNVSFIGKYEFNKGQIISIKKHGIIPILASGIKIEHNVDSFPQKIMFLTFGSPNKLIANIEKTGFLTGSPENEVQHTAPKKTGLPVKIFPVIGVIIIWNLLFLADQYFSINQTPGKPGVLSVSAIVFIVILSLSIKKNPPIANVFLKQNRSVGEIMPTLNLLILVSGIMSIAFASLLIFGIFE